MLKSCQYCGRIHDKKYICLQKAQRIKERQSYRSTNNKKASDFHSSQKWTDKSLEIRQRDNYCCQVCIRGLYDPDRQYETDDISVHHIIPVAEGWDRRMDNDNLITLCSRHHEMAEKNEIKRKELLEIAEEQEENGDYPVCG